MPFGKAIKQAFRAESFDPEFWFGLTLISAILSGIVVAGAAVTVYTYPGDIAAKHQAAQAWAPFLISLGAVVTLITVLWRGSISAHQAAQQRRQNDTLEESNLALLLEKAVASLKDPDIAKLRFGLAMLETVIKAPNQKYSEQALDFVVEAWPEIFRKVPSPAQFTANAQVKRIIIDAGAMGRITRVRSLDFEGCSFSRAQLSFFEEIPGGVYRNAWFRDDADYLASELCVDMFFMKCKFVGTGAESAIPIDVGAEKFFACTFQAMKIATVRGAESAREFIACDLSNADLSSANIEHIRFRSCSYKPGKRPIGPRELDDFSWENLLADLKIVEQDLEVLP